MSSPIRAARGLFDAAPFMVFWETTRACDLVCRHCRACAVPERSPTELTTAEGIRLLDEIRAMGCPLVVLTGGDPAKRPDLTALVRHGSSIGLRMALTPSATPLVTRKLLEELRDAGLSRLAVSLDGARRGTHDAFRGVHGSHTRTFEILRTARGLGMTTQVNTSVSRFNQHELELVAKQIGELDIELWGVFFVVPTGRAGTAEMLDKDEVEAVLERLADIAKTAPFDVKTTAAPHYRRLLLQRKIGRQDIRGIMERSGVTASRPLPSAASTPDSEGVGRPSRSEATDVIADGIGRAPRGVNDGQGICFVSHIGEIYPSGFMPINCGNVREEGITATYRDHPLFRQLREPDLLGGKCGACEFRKVCGGSRARAYAVTGDPLAEEPTCAYVPRGYVAEAS